MEQSINTNPRNLLIMPAVSPNSSDDLHNSQVIEIQKPDSMPIPESEPAQENSVDEEDHRGGDDLSEGSEDEDDLLLVPSTADQLICLRCGTRVATTINLRRHTSKYHPEVEVEMLEFLIKKAVELYPKIYAKIQSRSSKPTTSNVHSVGGTISLEPETSTPSRLGEGLCDSSSSQVSEKFPNDIISVPNRNQNPGNCQEKPFKCEHCGAGWSCKSKYDIHLRTHTGERPFICHECGKRFLRKSNLKQHMVSHMKEKLFVCQQCNKALCSAQALRQHELRHKGKFHVTCPHCDRGYMRKAELTEHLAIHSGERAVSCKQCGKTFVYKHSLAVHMRSHSDERPYACDQCTMAFKYRSNLRNHLKVHTGKKSQLQ
ncbi:unnamed protein product [Orchesella dallaii]|uniref:C2H2-type domain-containing protein n=1 Tax=Orchesella dallaii TaxID=48710 RepID=A0ABP1PIE0_9HEXA